MSCATVPKLTEMIPQPRKDIELSVITIENLYKLAVIDLAAFIHVKIFATL